MRKFLGGGKEEADGETGEVITLDLSSNTFEARDLAKALAHAESVASKKKKVVSVHFPGTKIVVKKLIKVAKNVSLVGAEGNEIVLEEGGTIASTGKNCSIENISFVTSAAAASINPVIAVWPKTSLSLKNCRFSVTADTESPPLGISVRGHLDTIGCMFSDWKLEVEKTGSFNIENTKFLSELGGKSKSSTSDPSALTIFSIQEGNTIKSSEVRGYVQGVLLSSGQKLLINDSIIFGLEKALSVEASEMEISSTQFEAPHGTALDLKGVSRAKLENCKFNSFASAVSATSESRCKLEGCSFEGGKSSENALSAAEESHLTLLKCTIQDVSGTGISVDSSALIINDSEITDCQGGGIKVTNGGRIDGEKVKITNSGENALHLNEQAIGLVKALEVTGSNYGVVLRESSYLQLNHLKCTDTGTTSIDVIDSGIMVQGARLKNSTTEAVGISVLFSRPAEINAQIRDAVFIDCSTGAVIEEPPRKADAEEINSSIEFQNCSFVKCKVGCSVDRAAVRLYGCSFVMSKVHSLIIHNQFLRNVGQLRKEAKLKIRWANFIEQGLEDGDALSNNPTLLQEVTFEQEFRMLQDFEKVLYRPRLTERLRQARTCFRSKDQQSMMLARIIMKSISHVLKLVKSMTKEVLEQEIMDDPDLGMFTATFQLDTDKKGKTNTLVDMEHLLESWENLTRTRLFDTAIAALNEAFERKQVDEDLYDECVAPLEEMQRVCYTNSKYNRRRDYLLTTAKEGPLTTWFFLEKESKTSKDGKRLRNEILLFLAADDEKYRLVNKTNFHASWVAQWASTMLGRTLGKSSIPGDHFLRKAWADRLLDDRKAFDLLAAYSSTGYNDQIDQLMKFEAYQQIENGGTKLQASQYNVLKDLLGGQGFQEAVRVASRLFYGEGALPGFLRRTVEKASTPAAVLEALKAVNSDMMTDDKDLKNRRILATMAHYFWRDSPRAPRIIGTKALGYETCPMCFVQKLQPWNELHLESCRHNHVFCRGCLKESMSTGSQDLWGMCPGTTDDGNCTAMATRREMELAGMETEKIYNILRVRVQNRLQGLPDWKDCNREGCVGGREGVTRTFFECRLCETMVTEDGGWSDPTVALKLCNGLDGSSAKRGAGVFRECYHCGVPYEKGDACSTITCAICKKSFSMTWGKEKLTHSFEDNGVGPQRYVPCKAGTLWKLGVFKTKKGSPLKMGQILSEKEAAEVVRRARQAAAGLK